MTQRKRQILGLIAAAVLILSFLSPQMQSYFSLQEQQRVAVGDHLRLVLRLPPVLLNSISVYVKEGEKMLSLNGKLLQDERFSLGLETPVLERPGKMQLQLKLFDMIPLKKINVDVLPNIRLVPGGHSIGVLLRTEGVMVIGYSPILNEKNEPCFPAKDADIMIGDQIVDINGKRIYTDDQVKDIIMSCGPAEKLNITIKRNNKVYKRTVRTCYCNDTKSYRIGLFIRDNAGGVGTLTFYDPVSQKFGALGHIITDAQTNQPLKIRQGKILAASIEDIQKAKKGLPGEKVGIFIDNADLGNIEKNEDCGIYGSINSPLVNPMFPDSLAIAYASQVKQGKAQILTVLKGQEIKMFDVNIEKVMYGRQDGKNMVIRLTDPALLKVTGGIIQGMSGSPIIQDGRIIGAVTHVFINDPQRGYGVFIENMLQEAGILQYQQTLGLNSQGFVFLSCASFFCPMYYL